MATAVSTPTGLALARELMDEFARSTGLRVGATPRRYLWTDAFAVGNLLGLAEATGEGRHLDLALRLVDQVHHVLGRHRPDESRTGWLSGLEGEEAERHPTIGGLRIGKPLSERRAGEPIDERLEWERDGQYLHYLTQWMHALERVAEATGQPQFRRWSIELLRTAHARFVVRDAGGPRRTIWKASVDLSRPLVPSMGQHDPLDAWLVALDLAAGATAEEAAGLARPIAELAELADASRWESGDPLGIGALLVGVHRLARRVTRDRRDELPRLARLVDAAGGSLEAYRARAPLDVPAEARLAFRELGLAIGLHAVDRLVAPPRAVADGVAALQEHRELATRIDRFWGDPRHRRVASWTAHRDINAVMLATSLAPEGYLGPG